MVETLTFLNDWKFQDNKVLFGVFLFIAIFGLFAHTVKNI